MMNDGGAEMERSDEPFNMAFAEVPVLSLASSDLVAISEMIGKFLALMRRRVKSSSGHEAAECEVAFERLERLQQQLAEREEGRLLALRLEDLLSLDGALMLFTVFLYVEVPKSERREMIIEALWQMREQLADMRRDRFHLN
jgi:hypothetical protein